MQVAVEDLGKNFEFLFCSMLELKNERHFGTRVPFLGSFYILFVQQLLVKDEFAQFGNVLRSNIEMA